MFEPSKRFYMTRAIAEELSIELGQYIFHYIFQYILKNHQELTDYLQIFEFYIENNQQWLIQRQEKSERETIIHVEFTTARPINRKVWVMDQVEHVMILFPEDY